MEAPSISSFLKNRARFTSNRDTAQPALKRDRIGGLAVDSPDVSKISSIKETANLNTSNQNLYADLVSPSYKLLRDSPEKH